MKTNYFKITDKASWLEKRKGYVTSTQVAALFGLSNYNTAFELYHIKNGNIEENIEENNFMKFGKIIEQPVCEMINIEHPDWKIEEFPYFAYDDEHKIGSSFDRVLHIDGKKYLLEIKSISYSQYKEKFTEHSPEDIEASSGYEIQMHTEMELTKNDGFEGVIMAVFILDTRQLRYIFRTYDPEVGKGIRKAVCEFWSMKEAPKPDYEADKSIIARACPKVNPDYTMDATENNRITELAEQYKNSKELEKQEAKNADVAYAELMMLLKDAKYAWTNYHKITVSDVKPNEGKIITPDMVGTVVGKRSGYKKLTIKESK
jgi:putative phage-type endonuclease